MDARKLQVSQEEQSSKVEVSQEEHAYRELTSRHANTRLQLEIGGIIGRGSFGTVHTARWRDGRDVSTRRRPARWHGRHVNIRRDL